MYSDWTACDQTFIMNVLGGPCISLSYPRAYDNSKYGKFSYQDVWTSLYGKAIVMGSKLVVHVKKHLYPNAIHAIISATGSSDTYMNKSLPFNNLTCGFWYIRYRYHRASKQGDEPEPVGHPMWFSLDPDTPGSTMTNTTWYTDGLGGEGKLWANQRDFMCDPTVTWIRDRLPRATKMKYSRSYTDDPRATDNPSDPGYNIGIRRKPLFPIVADTSGRVEYELELSNRPTKLIAAYSRRKHSMDENPLRNTQWQDLKTLQPITRAMITPESEKLLFQVRVGYVAFSADGQLMCNVPADRLGHYLDIQCSYKLRLREPLISPWTGEKPGALGARMMAPDVPSEPQFDVLDPELDEFSDDDDEEDDPLVSLEEVPEG